MKRDYINVVLILFFLLALTVGCGQKSEIKYKDLWSTDRDVKIDTIKADAVPDLIRLLEKESDESAKVESIRALGKIGDPDAIEAFKKLLDDNLDSVRLAVAYALGEIKTKECIPLLEQLMKDKSENIRDTAVDSLGALKDPAVIPLLVKIAIYDESEVVRGETLRFLGIMGDKTIIPVLENAVFSETDDARAHAAFALGSLGDSSSVPILLKALEDPAPVVRAMALLGLSKIKDSSSVPAIKKMLDTEKQQLVQVEAGWALCRLGDPSGKEILRNSLLKASEIEARGEAAKALADIGDTESIPLLKKATNDRSGLVREQAYKALKKLESLK